MPILILLLLAVPAVASCPAGTMEYEGHPCSADPAPYQEKEVLMGSYTSDEKPPTDKMPSYERAGIKAEMPKSLIASDSDADRAKQDADSDGKKAAHVPQ